MLPNSKYVSESPASSPTQQPPTPPASSQQLTWSDWLTQIGSRIAHADPKDPRIQFVANLVKDAAHEAALHALPDPFSHYSWLIESAYELAPEPDNGPAAPIQPGTIAGHDSTWDLYCDDQHEEAEQ